MTITQTLGGVILYSTGPRPAFVFPEFAHVAQLISDGTVGSFAVLQSSAPAFRQSARTWTLVEEADAATLRGYAESKDTVTFEEEDGTTRPVVVMDYDQQLDGTDIWTVSALLLEMGDPTPPGS